MFKSIFVGTDGNLKHIDYASTSSEISTSEIQTIVDKLKYGDQRLSTKNIYHSVWKHFNEFFIKLDSKPSSWEERLILFVGHLINNNRKSSTIRSYISAIKAVLAKDGHSLNEDKVLLKSLTRACKLENDTVKTRLPIQKGMLYIILGSLSEVYQNQPYLMKLYRELFTTAYFGMMRVGELTASQHTLKAKDVHIGTNKDKLLFVLHSSKTHGKNKPPQTIKISKVNDYQSFARERKVNINVCPFGIINDYMLSRNGFIKLDEPFFVFRDKTPVKAENMRGVLKGILKKEGFQQEFYNTQSFRAGRSVDLWKANIDLPTIARLGRWSSNAIYSYFKFSY